MGCVRVMGTFGFGTGLEIGNGKGERWGSMDGGGNGKCGERSTWLD